MRPYYHCYRRLRLPQIRHVFKPRAGGETLWFTTLPSPKTLLRSTTTFTSTSTLVAPNKTTAAAVRTTTASNASLFSVTGGGAPTPQDLRPYEILEVKASAPHWTSDGGEDNDNDNDNSMSFGGSAVAYAVDPHTRGWIRKTLRHHSRRGNGTIQSVASSVKATVKHFLPAGYPQCVAPGYAHFCQYAFVASVAGSAAMVLSTQTLLLAVGVIGSAPASTAGATAGVGVMAGALNWVLKDGVGQLGGVLYASQQSKSFDAHPKKTRMLAAIALDAASLLEILSPSVPAMAVLPVACVANILKNVGYLTASASRAALHQSLSKGNLADVTAKAGSQSMAAGLLGTAVGIGLSAGTAWVQTPHDFVMAWCVLSTLHQAGNYWSLRSVVLNHFNRQRLELVLQRYMDSQFQVVSSPTQVAAQERYYDFVSLPVSSLKATSSSWLSVGSRLDQACPVASDLPQYMAASGGEPYLLTVVTPPPSSSSSSFEDPPNNHNNNHKFQIHLTFVQGASGDDVLRGALHAFLLRQCLSGKEPAVTAKDGAALSMWDAYVRESYTEMQTRFPQFLESLHAAGWTTATERTIVESSRAHRLVGLPGPSTTTDESSK